MPADQKSPGKRRQALSPFLKRSSRHVRPDLERHVGIRLLAVALFAVLVVGRASNIVTYSENWASVNSSAECSAVVGTYRQNGERAPADWEEAFLRSTNLATFNEVDFRASHVTLSSPEPDVFLIEAGGEQRFRFKEGEATCSDGKIQLKDAFALREWLGRRGFTVQSRLRSPPTDG